MSYSRRQLYALGEPIGDSATYKEGGRTIYGSGGGGGGQTTTTGTTYNTNIPEYAQPYVETMLGSAQQQIYNTDASGQVVGFKPYVPYSTNMDDYVAAPSPLQEQSYTTAANMQVPGQYGTATGLAGTASLGSLGLAGQMAGAGQQYAQQATNPNAVQAYMSPYMQNVVDYQKSQALRDYNIGQQVRKAQAVGQGAFGGTRQAIAESEAERALQSQLQGIAATGSQKAFEQAQQAQQYGATLGLQGQQGALQGLGQTLQGAQTLGQLGTSDLAAQINIANLQNQYGAQLQALEQQKINQAIQNYATAQQYPYMQLGILNSLLRGLPMQSTTVESYQATPSIGQQAAGLGITGLGAYKTLSGFKEGGEVKGYASRGLAQTNAGRNIEGSLRAKLEMMTPQQLEQVAKTSQSPELRAMAEEVLAEHMRRDQAEQQARQAIAQEQAAKPQMPQEASAGLAAAPAPNMDNMAGGGIVAFAGEDGSLVEEEDPFAGIENKQLREVALGQEQLRRAYGYKDGAYDQYKKFLEEKQAGLANEREGVIGMGLMDLGSRIATTPGPYGAALGQSIQGALPGFQKGVAEFKKAKADVYKAQADVAKAENDLALGRADKTQAAYAALRKEENDLKRTQMQIEGNIRAAGVSANRATDLDKTTEAFLADRLAKGEPDNARTRAAARSDALAATGFAGAKVITGQEQAVTTALDKDDQLTGLNKRLNMLQITPKQAQKNATEIESLKKQIAAREQEVRNRVLRQEQPEAPAGGRMKFDAQGNPV